MLVTQPGAKPSCSTAHPTEWTMTWLGGGAGRLGFSFSLLCQSQYGKDCALQPGGQGAFASVEPTLENTHRNGTVKVSGRRQGEVQMQVPPPAGLATLGKFLNLSPCSHTHTRPGNQRGAYSVDSQLRGQGRCCGTRVRTSLLLVRAPISLPVFLLSTPTASSDLTDESSLLT